MVLKDLTQLRSVSGDEGAVRDYIIEKAKERAAEVRVDRIGNVFAFKKGTGGHGRRVLLAAHMDEIGLIVRGIQDNGLLSYQPVGGIDARVMVSKRVQLGKDAVPGAIGAKAIHLQSQDELAKPLSHEQLFIDIGAKDRASAEKLVKPGDYASLWSEYVEFGDGFVKAKALDDRVGCFNLLRLLNGEYAVDLTCVFTVQEEVGLHGAAVASHQADCDCAIILEGTAANDLGDVDEHMRVCTPGNGVAISFMDNASIAHPGLARALRELAQKEGVAWQVKAFVSGGNDAGAFQTGRGATPACVLSVPCRYIHSHGSVACLADIDAQYQLARAFLRSNAAFDA